MFTKLTDSVFDCSFKIYFVFKSKCLFEVLSSLYNNYHTLKTQFNDVIYLITFKLVIFTYLFLNNEIIYETDVQLPNLICFIDLNWWMRLIFNIIVR
jgi:hypothetical protein